MPKSPAAPDHDPRITPLPAAEIRRRYLDFFAARGHTVVPSASLVPAGDPTLLFTNSGMVQFKEVLTGAETRSYTRAVDVQRCLRVAGKHNDFEEVGRTPRHHTLFEMMGNWSFGDYFKREAIHWAWEFLTVEMGIPGERLAATTYRDDEVAWAIWRDEIGLPPERMARWGNVDEGDDKNFWRMAETGPCGPCSEIHFDRGPELSEGPECVPDHSEHCPRWLEIWNLVFMEFNQLPDGPRVPLPFTSVDTGLGLERLASVLQGVLSNYDTDLFTPIHETLRRLLGHDPDTFEAGRFSYQVIADHSRAMTFLVADGVLPSNEGRGYVLRRIIRRAVRHGRLLGRREPFLVETAATVIDVMGDAYPLLRDERERILAAIAREEAQFARTLDAGTAQLEEALIPLTDAERVVGRRPEEIPTSAPVLAGGFAFRLHDTYGFPIDLTIELAAEYGVRVDRAGFEVALAEQRERSRGGRKAELARHAEQTALYEGILRRAGETAFVGYETTAADGRVLAILRDGTAYEELTGAGEAEVILDRTPFYAEGGGQVGDRGELREAGGGSPLFRVEETLRPAGALVVHRGTLHGRLRVGETVSAVVDAERRARTMRNHTGTHLLHRALRNVAGPSARQAGSLVAPDYLRFDYPFDRAAHRRRATPDRGRGAPDRPRGSPGDRVAPADGRGDRGRRRRLLRREVRRDRPDGPRRGLQLRAVRRDALPRVRPDGQLRHHRRPEHRLRDAPDRGAHGRRRRRLPARARRPAGARRGSARRPGRGGRPGPDRRPRGGAARGEAPPAGRRRRRRPEARGAGRRGAGGRAGRPPRRPRRPVGVDRRAEGGGEGDAGAAARPA